MFLVAFSNINLDNSAQELYQQLGGLDTEYRDKTAADMAKADKKLAEEEAKTDKWRLLMTELAHLLSAYFSDVRFSEGIRTQKDYFDNLLKTLEKLSVFPGHDGNILIRYRGFPTGTGISADSDYVISLGNLEVDAAAGAAMLNRMGVRMSHLSGRLNKAFKVFSENAVSSLYLKLPKAGIEFFPENLKDCLRIISRYHRSFKQNMPIVYEKDGKNIVLPIMNDEKGHADINLTILAGINHINAQMMADIVRKVGNYLNQNESFPFVSVYDAVFNIRNLKEKLIKPMIEVNNIKRLSLDKNHTVVSKESVKVTRAVTEHFGDSPQNAAMMIQTVYGNDYQQISPENFGERLKLATDLLDTVSGKEGDIEGEILRNMEEHLEDVREEVFEDIVIQKNTLKVRSGESETVIGKINNKISSLLSFYKGRAEADKKLKNISRKAIRFDDRDYEIIAKDFDISKENAKELTMLLQSCFNSEGRFLRSVFERHIPEFARYEDKVFRFLWHYLKETPARNDRVAFLNSLQLLIARMKKPKHAIEILLNDMLKTPRKVIFSDRNALILCNMLIRTYNHEINVDTELTPEEVLLVRNGLNLPLIHEVADLNRKNRESLFEKLRAIYSELIRALEGDEDAFPLRFLLYLEREIHIFMALVGGNSARAILRSAIKRYGNPESEAYRLQKSNDYAELLVQHLTVAIRGLERVGDTQDLKLLEDVRHNLKRFSAFSRQTRYVSKLNRLTEWVNKAEKHIHAGIWQEFAQAA